MKNAHEPIRRTIHEAKSEHQAFRDDLIVILRKHAGHLQAQEMLALAAHLVGQLIALQDQQSMTPERAMQIVTANIERGNAEAIGNLFKTEGEG